jgi:hypothetical protein
MKITRSGLFAITCSVALLWACILGEQAAMRRAYAERAAVMRVIESRQRKQRPARVSTPRRLPPARPALG